MTGVIMVYAKRKRRRIYCIWILLGTKNYSLNRSTSKIAVTIPKKRGAPYGNKNALGNKGGCVPVGNMNIEKHGLYTSLDYQFQMIKIEESLSENGQYRIDMVR